jgi:hypothetical protein
MRKTSLFVSIVAGALLVAAYSLAAEAPAEESRVLGPAKPSDIVTVSTGFENPCPGSPTSELSRVFNRLEGSDGTAHPFAIPVGKVLVITSADLAVFAGGPPYQPPRPDAADQEHRQ